MSQQIKETSGITYLKGGKLVFRDANDVNGLEVRSDGVYDSNGDPWASGVELGYAEITSNVSITSTSDVDVAGLSATVTVGARPIRLIFDAQSLSNDTAATATDIRITDSSNTVLAITRVTNPAASTIVAPVHREIRLAPAAGERTYKIRTRVSGGTGTLTASATSPAFFQVLEC